MGTYVLGNVIQRFYFKSDLKKSVSSKLDTRGTLGFTGRLVFLLLCVFATIDRSLAIAGYVEEQKLLGVGGYSVAIGGNRIVVGSPSEANDGGAVRVYLYDGSIWIEEQMLTAPDGQDGDGFGLSVAINSTGDRIVVGAPGDSDNGLLSGSVYVFSLNAGNWVQEQKIIASDGEPTDQFGRAVGISFDRIVVGSPFDDDKASRSGAVYVYRFNTGTLTWEQEQKLVASDGAHEDSLGYSVAIEGERIVAGAIQTNNCGCLPGRSGFAYVIGFDNGSGNWAFKTKLSPADGTEGDLFGNAVSIHGNWVVVGSWFGNYAYVFQLDNDTFLPLSEQKLQASDGTSFSEFGFAVAIAGDRLVVGAPRGSKAHLFEFEGAVGAWIQKQTLIASDGSTSGQFGRSVSLTYDLIAIASEGSAYIFRFTPDSDGDGVPDDQDLCPNTPSGAAVDANGCASSQLDTDGDRVTDDRDQCPNSDIRPTIIIDSCNSGVANESLPEPAGCTITDEIMNLAADAQSHGQFVSQVDKFLQDLQSAGILGPNEKNAIKDCAAQSTLP